jgi:penicillin-binding protein 2
LSNRKKAMTITRRTVLTGAAAAAAAPALQISGAEAAAPIARRVFDYLLQGLYPSDEDIAATRIGKSSAPIGTQRNAADVPLPGQPVVPTAPGAVVPAPAASAPAPRVAAAASAPAQRGAAAASAPAQRVAAAASAPVQRVAAAAAGAAR